MDSTKAKIAETSDTDPRNQKTEQEFTISDELYEISEATNKDGTVDVEIIDFAKVNDGKSVSVVFRTPTNEKKVETMDWPERDTADYKFVRICRRTVGSLSGADWLKTDGAKIRADTDSWEIQADLSKVEKVKSDISNITVETLAWISGVLILSAIVVSLLVVFFGLPIYGALTIAGVVSEVEGLVIYWFASGVSLGVIGSIMEEA